MVTGSTPVSRTKTKTANTTSISRFLGWHVVTTRLKLILSEILELNPGQGSPLDAKALAGRHISSCQKLEGKTSINVQVRVI
ncbi:MAG: hypothetical protein Q8P52_02850 [bacterium]|nr:hypothetical protein [bacterium]